MFGFGALQAMIDSLKENNALRQNRKHLSEINKEYPKKNKKPFRLKKVSEAQKAKYREKLKRYKKHRILN